MKELTIRKLYELKKKEYILTVLSSVSNLEHKLDNPELNRPGLALSGYIERFSYNRLQILGETEVNYLQYMNPSRRYDNIKNIMQFDIPAFIVTKGLTLSEDFIFLANEYGVSVLQSRLPTNDLLHKLDDFLCTWFAPIKTIHGTLVDVFGVGILITGKSGIGKSECALDLIERGHRFIADDMVKIRKKSGVLIGETNKQLGYLMEIRGIGLIDIEKMFGIEAIGIEKRIETQVELIPWRRDMDYERIGLKDKYNTILDVDIPITYLPISPGKNITVIIEVIAMNYMLKISGHNIAQDFQEKLQQRISKKNPLVSLHSKSKNDLSSN